MEKYQTSSGGYFIKESQIKYLEGRLLTLIEALGLEKNQVVSLKSLVSQEVWDLLEPSYTWIEEEDIKKI